MSLDVTITVPLTPIGKGRPRVGRTKAGHAVAFTPAATRSWEAQFRELVAKHLPGQVIEGPLRVDILAVLARPQSLMRKKDPDGLLWAPTKPDYDNVAKIVADSLSRHLRDDKQIVCGMTLKVYAERDGLPRTVVRIRGMDVQPSPASFVQSMFPFGGEA